MVDFLQSRIKGAIFFDIDKVADKSVDLPHTAPTAQQFSEQVSDMGINNDDHVICYDKTGLYMASARAWWLFRLFGHYNVSVLERGFIEDDWKDTPQFIGSGPFTLPPKGSFKAKETDLKLVKNLNQVLDNIKQNEFQLLDARSAERFAGKGTEPRPNMKKGHVPHSFNLPFSKILKDKKFLDKSELELAYKQSGLDLSKPITTSCGSGVTACVLSLGLDTLGFNSAVYDGSWAEYGQEKLKNPVDTM